MATVSIPYTFAPGEAYSAQVNANFTACANAINNIDNTNIGAAGLFASDLLPTNGTQATFGGAQTYTFPADINVSGNVGAATVVAATVYSTGQVIAGSQVLANNATAGAYCPPVYTNAGGATGVGEHVVRGTIGITVNTTNTFASATVALSGAAAFTNVGTYNVVCSYQGHGTSFPNGWTTWTLGAYSTRTSGAAFIVYVENAQNATGSGTVYVDYIAMGY